MKAFLTLFSLFPLFIIAQINLPEGFTVETVVTGIQNSTSITISPDDRLFVTEKSGNIRVIQDGELLPDPLYSVETETFVERGLLNIVLHPDFPVDPKMYLFYTVPNVNHNRILRIEANGNSAVLGSDSIIMDLSPMSSFHHNGGGMVIDDENHLIVSCGDGTNAPQAQALTTTNGKLLRMNLDGTIPTDNPFYNETTGNVRATLAGGLRNPFTMARNVNTGKTFFNDVGSFMFEEVNEVDGVANYGWPIVEGPIQGQTPPDNYTDPVLAYDHSEGCAAVGAAFYDPEEMTFPEEYHDKYLFMDYCEGFIRVMDPVTYEYFEMLNGLFFPVDLEVDHHGDIFVLQQNGTVLKISFSGTGEPFIINQSSDVVMAVGEDLELQVNQGGLDPFTFLWYENGNLLTNQTSNTLSIENLTLAQNGNQYYCHVFNDLGDVVSQTINLTVVDGDRPQVSIGSPDPSILYSGGDIMNLTATANDTEDGIIDPNSVVWIVDFHHNVHTHPVIGPVDNIDNTNIEIPTIGELDTDVFYRLIAQVTDSDGLSDADTVDVLPEMVQITIDTDIGVIDFAADEMTISTGESFPSVKGMQRSLQAPELFVSNNTLYQFNNWENGTEELTQIYSSVDTLIEASYSELHEYILGENTENVIGTYFLGTGNNKTYYDSFLLDEVNENYGNGNPVANTMPTDSFGVKYQGKLLAPYTGQYTIYLFHDGFASLSTNNVEILSNTFPDGVRDTVSTQVFLEAGQSYNFEINYEHYFNKSRLRFSWSFSAINEVIIPAEQLYFPDLDMALSNQANSSETLFANDEVTYTIDVQNQGATDIRSSVIKYHLPDGIVMSDPDWNPDGTYELGYLEAYESTSVELTLTLDPLFEGSELITYAEIASQTNGGGINDLDSTNDEDPFNDAGGAPGTDSDNSIEGDGSGNPGDDQAATDEDDHDPELLKVCNIMDIPTGLESIESPPPDNNPNLWLLKWDPVPASTVCQVQGSQAGSSATSSLLVYGDEPSEKIIFAQLLDPGQTYQWRVRCACSIGPLIASGFSDYDFFTIPSVTLLGNEELDGSQGQNVFSLSPNPTNGNVLLETSLPDYTIHIYSVAGDLVFSEDSKLNGPQEFLDLNLIPGLYIVKVSNTDGYLTKKLIVKE
ncbi:MAG: PQQ-dependent sugar dehydrogenase [Bacteroidota bacterium]